MALRKFTRYRNRKLHENGSMVMHVDMDELDAMVVAGEEIEVIDDATGEDLTVAVLARILYNRCMRDSTAVDVKVLRNLIIEAHKRAA
jgi:polyhydroxyalkanoate synthesis regulator protein